jgi:hypothetical protein
MNLGNHCFKGGRHFGFLIRQIGTEIPYSLYNASELQIGLVLSDTISIFGCKVDREDRRIL